MRRSATRTVMTPPSRSRRDTSWLSPTRSTTCARPANTDVRFYQNCSGAPFVTCLAKSGRPDVSKVQLKVNGRVRQVSLEGSETLLDVLRVQLGLTGAKRGCNQGVCGTCTVLIDGRAARSCLSLAALAEGKDIVTVEGLAPQGELSAVQKAFVDAGAIHARHGHCGDCLARGPSCPMTLVSPVRYAS